MFIQPVYCVYWLYLNNVVLLFKDTLFCDQDYLLKKKCGLYFYAYRWSVISTRMNNNGNME